MTHVVEINEFEQLRPFRQTWNQLVEQTPGSTFFMTFDWLEVYWQHFAARQALRVLLVYSDDTLVGILPLVVRCENTRAGELRFLTYPLDHWGSFYGPIGSHPHRTLIAGLCHLRRTRRDWDVFELRWVDANGVDRGQTQRALTRAGFPAQPATREQTALIDIEGTWESYLATRTSKWRNNMRRWDRRLHELGEVQYTRYRPAGEAAGEADPRWDLYDACEQVASRSWQAAAEDGTTLTHEAIRPFLRASHLAAVRLGAADLNLLWIDGQPAAFAYNYAYRGSLYGLRIGYDSALASGGAGNMMYIACIRDSFQRGDRLYDLGPGSLDIKRHLWTRTQPLVCYSHYRSTALRAQLVRLKRWNDQRRGSAADKAAALAS